MHVSLSPQLDAYVLDKVKSGRYNSASEVIREALRLMQEREEERMVRVAEVRQKLAEGQADIDAGRYFEGTIDEVRERVRSAGRRAPAARKAT
jgi:antitoxin ParD1/3/4